MNEGVYIKVTKGDLGAYWFSKDSWMRVGEDCAFVIEEVIKEVVL